MVICHSYVSLPEGTGVQILHQTLKVNADTGKKYRAYVDALRAKWRLEHVNMRGGTMEINDVGWAILANSSKYHLWCPSVDIS